MLGLSPCLIMDAFRVSSLGMSLRISFLGLSRLWFFLLLEGLPTIDSCAASLRFSLLRPLSSTAGALH